MPATGDKVAERVSPPPLPKWLPISMLAFSTVALAVPLVFLRRQRTNTLANTLKNQKPPPRRSGSVTATNIIVSKTPKAPITPPVQSTPVGPPSSSDLFNAPLYGLKAFGYATLLVTFCGAATIWGVKAYVGVEDTREFATCMRRIILTKMPILSARIYRSPEEPVDNPIEYAIPERWNWTDAEKRLKDAFEAEGFTGCAKAVSLEVEMERQLERQKRGLESTSSQS